MGDTTPRHMIFGVYFLKMSETANAETPLRKTSRCVLDNETVINTLEPHAFFTTKGLSKISKPKSFPRENPNQHACRQEGSVIPHRLRYPHYSSKPRWRSHGLASTVRRKEETINEDYVPCAMTRRPRSISLAQNTSRWQSRSKIRWRK